MRDRKLLRKIMIVLSIVIIFSMVLFTILPFFG